MRSCHVIFYKIHNDPHLKVSTTDPESAVLVGFESKLNVLGLCECGDAVVELGYHIFESLPWLGIEPKEDEEENSINHSSSTKG